MRVFDLTNPLSRVYSSNVYLILGSWSRIQDVNTLVDVGTDAAMFDGLRAAPTGVGKKPVDQVVLTHSHFDHMNLLSTVRELYDPRVYALSPATQADVLVQDGQMIQCGDRVFEVIHVPGHSEDSICLYCDEERVLFAGDTPVIIRSTDSTYGEPFIKAMQRLSRKRINVIYFGHGPPLLEGAQAQVLRSIRNITR